MYSLHKTELLLSTEFLLIGKKAYISVLKSFTVEDIQQDIYFNPFILQNNNLKLRQVKS